MRPYQSQPSWRSNSLLSSGFHYRFLENARRYWRLCDLSEEFWMARNNLVGADLRAARRELGYEPATGRLGDPALPTPQSVTRCRSVNSTTSSQRARSLNPNRRPPDSTLRSSHLIGLRCDIAQERDYRS